MAIEFSDYPSVLKTLHFSLDDTCHNFTELVKGVPAVTFTGSFIRPTDQEKVDVVYYWSYEGGESYPLLAELTYEDIVDNKTVLEKVVLDFTEFLEMSPDKSMFLPATDMACDKRKLTVQLDPRIIPDYFSYQSEVVMMLGDRKTLFPRTEWYDYDMQASRTDYNPLVHYHDTFTIGPKITEVIDFLTGTKTTTTIHDYTRIFYVLIRIILPKNARW